MSSSEPCCDCARASNFLRSVVGKAAASRTAPRPCSTACMLLVSICANEAGFFAISFSRSRVARSSASMASISSFSPAEKSEASLSRTRVASFSSPSPLEMAAASSPIFDVETSMSLLSCALFASTLPCVAVRVLMVLSVFLDTSSHHSMYSWYAFASASPSFVTFAARSSTRVKTFDSGFSCCLVAAAGAAARRMRSATRIACICS
mmetsp:Transcript_37124/g.95876  ORF Transcript_37124/g.95876 Transcript_37124/m.95876 type:complete len:207 (+) Transcript_37124:91-711(+)